MSCASAISSECLFLARTGAEDDIVCCVCVFSVVVEIIFSWEGHTERLFIVTIPTFDNIYYAHFFLFYFLPVIE